ncbi:MAG: carbamoyl-phosphate synthase (glutamine-hydrolyzing) large subunit [Firmicutes bacterium]|nr:carbamoyl-phosphate synthase (glutamine-hydrolyzing) large subunit [Bacillota bacterium]MDD7602068.1 carbamoyl-phosphate synthase (glutamine-hydrolyzing) large subunit [Bacillota bacterium]MDY5855390.1 carbamoyl-phosphate synthase (glutamine-hydrolyzing) large subunit [Anaerovoracaceae bacterium]
MLKKNIKKVLIIGSGPIIIGQAAEFDYAGTQCCKAIREEGIETILINSNPATIMTDQGIADRVYIQPLTCEAVEAVLRKERPDGILAGFGGQTGLNLAMELEEKGILEELGTELLGVNRQAIEKAEDREQFKKLMNEIGEPIPASAIATSQKEAADFVQKEGFPVIIRPAFTLGGTGGGIAKNEKELKELVQLGIEKSAIGQVLIEKSVAGWKEIEYEVIRDGKDNCIIICSMENLDPVGIHTGDSIVVAPTQTLADAEYQMLRNASLKIIRALKIEGGCNVQFALNPDSSEYIVIEVNPRVSRSSALASKAAGYPIAKIAAKIALGYSLDELSNYITEESSALFEPAMDYCVVKFPKWPFDKFRTASRKLGTQMKATGEVMSICRSFESALLKAVTSLEVRCDGLRIPYVTGLSSEKLEEKLMACDDERLFVIAELLRRERMNLEEIHERTRIDMWFLSRIANIVHMEKRLEKEPVSAGLIEEAETMGFTDAEILSLTGMNSNALHDLRTYYDIHPVYKMVDTCAGEFEAATPYYYSCYDEEDESAADDAEKVLVVGSGPIRIGQGIEFDYCCVQGVWALRELGYESIIVNNNPETVSTDFDTADKLYFEALHVDDIMNVIKKERPKGVILQLGGQTALNLAEGLSERGIPVLGTRNKYIDLAEDREKFSQLLHEIDIPTPDGGAITHVSEAAAIVEKLGYPLIVRPSFVIGGRAMQVVYNDEELYQYLKEAVSLSTDHPVLIDKYVEGIEFEVDAVADGENLLVPGVMEHIERTGIHSGDSISVYPAYSLPDAVVDKAIDYTERISRALHVCGLMNVQYVYDGKEIYVIEVNPRASRTVPILSKVTGVQMVKAATAVMLGQKLPDLEWGCGLYPKSGFYAVKVPVFSNAKLTNVDVALGPEMRSTGEVLGMDPDLDKALYKGFLGAGMNIFTGGGVYVSLRNHDKTKANAEIMKEWEAEGFRIYGSAGTAQFLKEETVDCEMVPFEEVGKMIGNKIQVVINVPQVTNNLSTEMFPLRRQAIEHGLPVLTCMDTARAYLKAVKVKKSGETLDYPPIFG